MEETKPTSARHARNRRAYALEQIDRYVRSAFESEAELLAVDPLALRVVEGRLRLLLSSL